MDNSTNYIFKKYFNLKFKSKKRENEFLFLLDEQEITLNYHREEINKTFIDIYSFYINDEKHALIGYIKKNMKTKKYFLLKVNKVLTLEQYPIKYVLFENNIISSENELSFLGLKKVLGNNYELVSDLIINKLNLRIFNLLNKKI